METIKSMSEMKLKIASLEAGFEEKELTIQVMKEREKALEAHINHLEAVIRENNNLN